MNALDPYENGFYLINQPITSILCVAPYVKYKLNIPEEFNFNKVISKLKNMAVLVLSRTVLHGDRQMLCRTIILQNPAITVKIMHQQRSDIYASFLAHVFSIGITIKLVG
jgi:hypothetical protein